MPGVSGRHAVSGHVGSPSGSSGRHPTGGSGLKAHLSVRNTDRPGAGSNQPSGRNGKKRR